MRFTVVGGPFEGVPLNTEIPGYEVDEEAATPTLRWVGGVPLRQLRGGPLDGARLPMLPAGYEEVPGSATPTAEWTGAELLFERPYRLKHVWPGTTVTYCSACGILSKEREADELWVIVHRRTGTRGHFRVYCKSHLPQQEWQAEKQEVRQPCPVCATLMPLSGVCDYCG